MSFNLECRSKVLWVAVVAAAGVMVLRLCLGGLRIFPDSLSYLEAAETLGSLGAGGGSSPLGHFPPLLPLALLFLTSFFPSIESFFLLNITSLLLSGVLLSLWVRELGLGRNAGLFAALLFFSLPHTYEVYRAALSEPVFIALLLASLRYFVRQKNLLSGVCVGLTVLTRYAGGALLIALPLARVIEARERGRFHGALKICVPAFILLLLWIALLQFGFDKAPRSGRVVNTPNSFELLELLISGVTREWLSLGSSFLEQVLGGLVLFIPVGTLFWRRYLVIGVSYICYFVVILISKVTVDAEIPLNNRIFYPALVFGIIPSVVVYASRFRRFGSDILFFATLGAVFLAGILFAAPPPSSSVFETTYWRSSETVEWLQQAPEPNHIYSNAADFLSFFSGLEVSPLPKRFVASTRAPVPNSLEEFAAQLHSSEPVYFVFHTSFRFRWYLWQEEALVKSLHLELVAEMRDSRIYRLPSSGRTASVPGTK
ncbi:DUF2079 domain-containing protein [bacterium]|nr:DUF2079 domain-containing protein [bacterium]